ncbi:MAG: AraC family transcriptional regulator [Myxococcota bacterium]
MELRGAHAEPHVVPRVHPHAALGYILAGEGVFWCGAQYRLGAGDLILVPEGVPHYARWTGSIQGLGLSLCLSCLDSSAGAALKDAFHAAATGAPAARSIPPPLRRKLEGALRGLMEELHRPAGQGASEAQDLAVDGYLSLVASILMRADTARLDAASGPSLSARALAFVSRNATEGISLLEVAEHVGRTPAHTAAMVKADTGRTVLAWISEARMAAARQLLLRTDETVETVAQRVGFASPSHFHRVFRRGHGVTPSAWRAAHAHVRQAHPEPPEPV